MLVFMDESGDAGTNTRSGSAGHFACAGVVFERSEDELKCRSAFAAARAELGWPDNQSTESELKWEKGEPSISVLLSHVHGCRFSAFAALVAKREMNHKERSAAKSSILIWTYLSAIQAVIGRLRQARIRIDKIGSKSK